MFLFSNGDGKHDGACEQDAPSQYYGAIVAPLLRAMVNESGLLLKQQEYQKYLSIWGRTFEHTKIFDQSLLDRSGMDVEFNTVFSTIGWQGF